MSSSDKLTIDDFTTVFVPMSVRDLKFLRNIFQSWLTIFDKPDERIQYIHDLFSLMLASLDKVSSLSLHHDHGTVSVH